MFNAHWFVNVVNYLKTTTDTRRWQPGAMTSFSTAVVSQRNILKDVVWICETPYFWFDQWCVLWTPFSSDSTAHNHMNETERTRPGGWPWSLLQFLKYLICEPRTFWNIFEFAIISDPFDDDAYSINLILSRFCGTT